MIFTKKFPTHVDLMFFVLEKMKDGKLYKRLNLYELEGQIMQKYKITSEENVLMQNNLSKICDRIGWAMTFLTKAEFIEKDEKVKFHYKITDLGLKAIEDVLKNNAVLDEKYLKENSPNYLQNWNIKKLGQENISTKEEENGQEFSLEEAVAEMKQSWESDFIEKLRSLDWQYFEDFCAKLIEKMGYGFASKRDIRVRDGGIDGRIYTDELGIKDKIYIQAKRYGEGNTVESKDLQAFLHILSKEKAKGVFITTSKFSKDAENVAADDVKSGNIALIDKKKLTYLASKYKCGLKVKDIIEILELDL